MEFSIVKEEGDSAFERFMEKDSSLQNIGANPKVDPTLPVPWEHAKRSGHTNAYTKTLNFGESRITDRGHPKRQ